VPKYLSDTRWEAHAKSISAIARSYAIIDALHIYIDRRREACILLEKMEN
jgi:hypothetical protein